MRRARYVYCPFAYNQNHLSTGGFTIRPYFCSQEASCRRLPVPLQSNRPHVWGENCQIAMPVFTPHGSSPRGWGKHITTPEEAKAIRFTPTRVGKTSPASLVRMPPPVHPHAGGENQSSSTKIRVTYGSPPRGWGKLQAARRAPVSCAVHPHAGGGKPVSTFCAPLRIRFTPTRVGKTASGWPGKTDLPVHPHAGGENCGVLCPSVGISGSPPRVWGKRTKAR